MDVMMDDDNKEDATAELQTRLLGDSESIDAPLLHVDAEQPLPGAPTPHTIEVIDEVTRGEKQPNQYRDAPFALLFVVHLITISYFGFVWGLPGLINKGDNNNKEKTYHAYDEDGIDSSFLSALLGLCFVCSLGSVAIISGAFALMIRYAQLLIQFSLIFSIAFTLVLAVVFTFFVSFPSMNFPWLGVIYFLSFAVGACYAYSVWHRIPFASANLVTATTAIRANLGVTGVAFGMCGVYVLWVFLWLLSLMGIYLHTRTCDSTTGDCNDDPSTTSKIAGVFFLLSFYWTSEVIKNVLVVTVAGIVGTWWFLPHEANAFWSSAIKDSFTRATSYSFGSICLGSLLVAIIQVLHQLVHSVRQSNQRNSLLLCIVECLIALLERAAMYFNKFANIYIGLYGYDYLTAGSKVMQLFRERGWTTIINDNLVYRTLALMNILVGSLTGCLGLLLAYLITICWDDRISDVSGLYPAAFFFPFIIATAMANVVLGVVASATDTVIVCFAEAPNEFQANYPELCQQMLVAWRQIYPNECGL